jgi:hypothetical protein
MSFVFSPEHFGPSTACFSVGAPEHETCSSCPPALRAIRLSASDVSVILRCDYFILRPGDEP